MDRTLVLIKPDGVYRGLIGEIISRFERKGLKIVGMKMMKVSPELSKRHYEQHLNKPFYPDLERFITSGPIVAMVIEGKEAVEVVRNMVGATNARKAQPGTIRGDLSNSFSRNLVHASDSSEAAKREIELFFKDEEILEWDRERFYFYAPDE
ncbi:MAG: nucleoside-diphosphate kinase [Candidatus Anstonellales archaeon]